MSDSERRLNGVEIVQYLRSKTKPVSPGVDTITTNIIKFDIVATPEQLMNCLHEIAFVNGGDELVAVESCNQALNWSKFTDQCRLVFTQRKQLKMADETQRDQQTVQSPA